MTGLSTVTQGWRRGEGAPPYRGGFTPVKVSLYSNGIPSGGRGVRPYHALSKVSTGIADLPTTARRRADEELPYHALSKVSTGIADLPAGAPCHRRLARGGSPTGIDISIFFEVRNYEERI